jgi:hypothetical protein
MKNSGFTPATPARPNDVVRTPAKNAAIPREQAEDQHQSDHDLAQGDDRRHRRSTGSAGSARTSRS